MISNIFAQRFGGLPQFQVARPAASAAAPGVMPPPAVSQQMPAQRPMLPIEGAPGNPAIPFVRQIGQPVRLAPPAAPQPMVRAPMNFLRQRLMRY